MSARRVSAAAFAAIFLIASPAFAQAPSPDCQKQLADNDVRFDQTIKRLASAKNGTPAQKCAAYRSHVDIMKQATPVFDKCTTGRARQDNLGQMAKSIQDFQEIIKRDCGGR